MKTKLIFKILFVIFILAACAPVTIPAPTKTATPSQTSTPVPQTLTYTPTIEWTIWSTPLNMPFSSSNEIVSIIDQLHPSICVRENLLMLTPTPIEPGMQVSQLSFTEISALPEPNPSYINERADNIDKSRIAFIGCQPRNCGKLYVRDNKVGKFYEINFGAATDLPLSWLQWINKDTVIVTQQGHLWIKIVAINVAKQRYEYYGMTSGCHSTPTP